MGSFAGQGGLAEGAYKAGQYWFGRLPGGLAIATTMANAAFGAACGSSIAACAVFTKFSLPEMKRHGYRTEFAGATIAAAGLLAMLIPPSVLMIVYGILTEQSIGTLFLAGVVPGLLLAVLYAIGIVVMVKVNPTLITGQAAGDERVTWKERLFSLREVAGIVVLMLIVLGGIYAGVFSPTEAGAAGAFGAFLLGVGLRKLTWRTLRESLLESGQTTAMIFVILIGATIYTKFLAVSGVLTRFVQWVQAGGWPPLVVLSALIVMYLILGCLLDSISMLTITLPFVFPISRAMQWDPIGLRWS